MSSSLDMSNRSSFGMIDVVDSAWIAGAMAGVEIPCHRDPEWKWAPFIEDVFDISELIFDLQVTRPGQTPTHGSVLDSIGGYVSLAGRVNEDGIFFPVPSDAIEAVRAHLSGISIQYLGGLAVIPPSEISKFTKIVPLRGPIEEDAEEVIA